ncbi:hypothetical protein LTR84_009338 [Exophiala bonariae]|uniref:Aminodeoxychorismate lyase n=1 Tax=Exophiala bonariae TaxID=1690606 RepID=A0AAV9MWD7_9EURO|nr:hypothetical protein LTR84_009338 [Exophiala bonariae]
MAKQSEEEIVAITSRPEFRIFTTLRFNQWNDADFRHEGITMRKLFDSQLLDYHCDRLIASARAFTWTEVVALLEREGKTYLYAGIDRAVSQYPMTPKKPAQGFFRAYRVRLNISREATIDITLAPMGDDKPWAELQSDNFNNFQLRNMAIGSMPPATCTVGIDKVATPATTFTTHKTSYRDVYDAARDRSGITEFPPTQYEVLLYNNDNEITEASLSTVYFYREGRWVTPAADCGGNIGVTRRLMLENGHAVEGRISMADLAHGEIVGLSNGARGFFTGELQMDRHSDGETSASG